MPRFKNGLARVGKVYYYCFRINGVQHKGSTRATDRTTAEKVVDALKQEALLGPQAKPLPIPTVSKLITSWIESHRTTFSHRHIESVEGFAKVWINPAIGETYINHVSTQSVLDLRRKILDAGRSPATANLMLRILKLLMSYAIRLGHIKALPFSVSPLRIQKKPRPTIPGSEMVRFLDAAQRAARHPQVGVMLVTMVGLGLRESELLGMRWEWLDVDSRTYQVGKAKGKEARVLPIPDWVWHRLASAPKTLSPWIFPNSEGRPYRNGHLRLPLERVCKALGLGHISMHRLRATFASLHAEAGTPITEIQGMLGHKNIATTMIYVETSLDAKRRAQDNLSQKLGLG